jgi:Cu/Ag efflux pump CusA
MAWVVIGGLISSTFFTLIAIPLIFLWFDRLQPWEKIKSLFKKPQQEA